MTQEDKDLLLNDLCSRLNTNLVCSIYRVDDFGVGWRSEILSGYCKGDIWDEFYFGDDCSIGIDNVSKIKPYLRPLSSMTEEQRFEYHNNCDVGLTECGNELYYDCADSLDWLNAYHFDYRGLIDKGLAIEAPEGMYN